MITSEAKIPPVRKGAGQPSPAIGRIERPGLREVWRHEALDFTRWLAESPDLLAEATGLELTLVEREAAAGDFSVDLLGEDQAGRRVVIENQLERSDHDHLGKLLTYLAAFEAKAAVWVVADPRAEHTRAIGWLNDSSDAEFYLLKAEAIQIGGPPPALLLTLITGPSPEAKNVARVKQESSEQQDRRLEFWDALIKRIRDKGLTRHAGLRPSTSDWLSTSVGVSGMTWTYRLPKRGWQVECYIDRGREFRDWNKAVFDWLEQRRRAIDEEFGSSLQWERRDPYQSAQVIHTGDGDWRDPPEEWGQTQDWMIEAMGRLVRAFEPHLAELEEAVPLGVARGLEVSST